MVSKKRKSKIMSLVFVLIAGSSGQLNKGWLAKKKLMEHQSIVII